MVNQPIGNHGLGMFLCGWIDLGPLLQGGTRILHLQYFFKYVLTYFLHLNSYLVTFLHNTICTAQLFCPFLLSASEFLSNVLFNYHLLYFCTALSLIIMLSCHYHLHKSKTLSQMTQCPFTSTLLLFGITGTYLWDNALLPVSPWVSLLLILSGDVSINPGPDTSLLTGSLINIRSIRNKSVAFATS